MARYSTIFFDFGNTLSPAGVWTTIPGRLRQTVEELGCAGLLGRELPEDEEVLALHARLHKEFRPLSKPGWVAGYERYYRAYAQHWLEAMGTAAEAASELAPRFAETFRDVSDRARVAYPDAHETLEKLRAMGFALAIVSNNDGTLLRRMRYLKLDGYFSLILDSAVVESNKPDPAIFKMALEQLKVEPGEVLHVGDLYENDVEPAAALGIDAAWLNRDGDPAPESVHRSTYTIRELAELPTLLG